MNQPIAIAGHDAPEPPAGDGRTARRMVNRDRIVTTARTMIATEGVESLSVRALAERVGLSVTTLYNLFGSKDGIINAARDQVIAEMSPAAAAASASADLGELRDHLTDAFDGVIRSMTRPLLLAIMDNPEVATRFFVDHRATAQFATSFTDAIARHELLPSADPAAIGEVFEAVISTTARLWATGVLDDDRRRARITSGIEIALLAHASAKGRRALLD